MRNKVVLAILLVFAGVLLRLITHGLNFAPVGAVALVAGLWLPVGLAVWVPLAVMGISDFFIGFHSFMPWVYGSYALIVVSMWAVRRMGVKGPVMALTPLCSAVLFYLVTNFGVWATTDMYARSFSGLLLCYERAIPFFRMTLLSDYLFAVGLYGLIRLGGLVYGMSVQGIKITSGIHSSVR